MNEIATLNHLVLYLYNETRLTDTVLIQNAIDNDEEIAETFQDLVKARDLINETLMTPSKRSVEMILNYSKLTAPMLHS